MPNTSPLEPGDVPYPQYSVTTTLPVKADLAIVKGVVYTMNSFANIEEVSTTLSNGIFQSRVNVDADPVAGDMLIQVLGPRSRMVFTALLADLQIGQDVNVVPDTIGITSGAKEDALYIGKIFEIYTRNIDGTKRFETKVGEKVVVETVGP